MGRRSVRRSQAVVPFGVGAIVDFEDEALIAAGLDAWPPEQEEDCLYDDRLAARLGVRYFRQPPAADGEGAAPLPYVRFPFWHFCPRCRALHRLKGNETKRPRCKVARQSPARKTAPCAELTPRQQRGVLPLRFVVACREGHIEDFPWDAWVHTSKGTQLQRDTTCPKRVEVEMAAKVGPDTRSDAEPDPHETETHLYFYPTQAGGLGGLVVRCGLCDSKRSLLGATGELRGFGCVGARPWLGSAFETCNEAEPPWVLQRGASNVYFPGVESSVLIPPFSKTVRRVVDNPRVWDALTAVREGGLIPEAHIKIAAAIHNVPFDELKAAVLAKDAGEGLGDANESEAVYRFAEYRALSRLNIQNGDYLVTRPQDITQYDSFARATLDAVVLVESLAETRTLHGFSRIEDGEPRSDLLSLAPKVWRPAYRVHGEGIFIVLKQSLLDGWQIGGALDDLVDRAARESRIKLPARPELVALHTLAHLLILRLAFEAGYGASSIRERLYSAPSDSTTPMRGILLYTAAGDSEGTLGGLVRLGKSGRFERILRNALTQAHWCSADPVCRESLGQGLGSLNLAACHACALLPETSCETGNRLLDRLSLVGLGAQMSERSGLFQTVLD